MSVLFTFPGQGAQSPGMLARLPGHPEVARTLGEARAALGEDPAGLDSEEALQGTRAVQLCLLIAGVAMARVLIARGAGPDMVAGMSVGAYPAAVVAGVLGFEDALQLVSLRGRLMGEAYPAGHGMTAVIGIDADRLAAVVREVHGDATPVFVANLNSDQQTILAGADGAMAAVGARALALGATRVERLAVSVPSHCPLLLPVVEALRQAMGSVVFRRPALRWISSSRARVLVDPASIADDLAGNAALQVNWRDSIKLAWECGARLAIEMPSRDTLTGLTQPVFTDGLALCSDNNRVDSLAALIHREKSAAAP